MLARVSLTVLGLAIVALAAPQAASPFQSGSAECVIVLEDGGCTNPCLLAGGPYDTARRAAGLEDETPELVCTM